MRTKDHRRGNKTAPARDEAVKSYVYVDDVAHVVFRRVGATKVGVKVVEMAEGLRAPNAIAIELYRDDRSAILSDDVPELLFNDAGVRLYLRGRKKDGDQVEHVCEFDNSVQRDTVVAMAVSALARYKDSRDRRRARGLDKTDKPPAKLVLGDLALLEGCISLVREGSLSPEALAACLDGNAMLRMLAAEADEHMAKAGRLRDLRELATRPPS